MRRYAIVLALLATGSSLASCSKSATEPPESQETPRVISGTVTLPSDTASYPVLIGDLYLSLQWSGATITDIDGTSPFTVSSIVSAPGGSTSRTYTYTLPNDPSNFGQLIAWVDQNENGLLDFPGEPARLPVKMIEGEERPIVFWGWINVGESPREADYLVSDGLGNNWGLLIVGATGFNFNF